jgi:hypothetical protein
LADSQGNEDILLGSSSSSPIEKGAYVLGVNSNEFKYSQKPIFTDWTGSPNEKSYTPFQIPYQNKLIIHLNEIRAAHGSL